MPAGRLAVPREPRRAGSAPPPHAGRREQTDADFGSSFLPCMEGCSGPVSARLLWRPALLLPTPSHLPLTCPEKPDGASPCHKSLRLPFPHSRIHPHPLPSAVTPPPPPPPPPPAPPSIGGINQGGNRRHWDSESARAPADSPRSVSKVALDGGGGAAAAARSSRRALVGPPAAAPSLAPGFAPAAPRASPRPSPGRVSSPDVRGPGRAGAFSSRGFQHRSFPPAGEGGGIDLRSRRWLLAACWPWLWHFSNLGWSAPRRRSRSLRPSRKSAGQGGPGVRAGGCRGSWARGRFPTRGAFLPVGVGSDRGSDLERPSGRCAPLAAGMRAEPASRVSRWGRAVPGNVRRRVAAPQPVSERIL